jgi:hypothetical protein
MIHKYRLYNKDGWNGRCTEWVKTEVKQTELGEKIISLQLSIPAWILCALITDKYRLLTQIMNRTPYKAQSNTLPVGKANQQ